MADEKRKSSDAAGLIIAASVVTFGAAMGGAGLGFLLSKTFAGTAQTASAKSAAATGEHGAPPPPALAEHGAGDTKQAHGNAHASKSAPLVTAEATKLMELAPITTKLDGSNGVWIRLEGALLYDAIIDKEMPVLAAKITEDFLIYIRSLRLHQVEGPGGLQTLIEDLNEKAQTRSGGKVHQLIVSGFIIE